ncbi:hypothetical protein ELQ35_05105 [Peribacillus cavernae]|uniref:Uncharacterized protein n=2 Tax=Peribacillus cavernae TaxID=1674310 RepID=A0A433HRI0_9BACI|nr:hypothetical protein ELQ35_05105 [Peribacillus cavernae]
MKKLYLLFVSVMLLLLVVSGCSTNEQSKKPEEQKQEASDKKVELTISAASSLQDALTVPIQQKPNYSTSISKMKNL